MLLIIDGMKAIVEAARVAELIMLLMCNYSTAGGEVAMCQR